MRAKSNGFQGFGFHNRRSLCELLIVEDVLKSCLTRRFTDKMYQTGFFFIFKCLEHYFVTLLSKFGEFSKNKIKKENDMRH